MRRLAAFRLLPPLIAVVLAGGCTPAPQPPAASIAYVSQLDAAHDAASLALLRRLLDRAAPQIGAVEIRSYALPAQWTGPQLDDAVAGIVREQRWRLLFASNMLVALAAQQATAKLPIVFQGADDPVRQCLVDSLTRPGRNATGYTTSLFEEPKMAEALIDAFPAVRTVIMLLESEDENPPRCAADGRRRLVHVPRPCVPGEDRRPPAEAAGEAGRRLAAFLASRGRQLRLVRLCGEHDVVDAAQIARAGPHDGFVVPYVYLFHAYDAALVRALSATGLPAVFPRHRYLALGAAMTVAPTSSDDQDLRAHELALRVLAGEPPARLPVQTPEGFELHFNLPAAARQGLVPSLAAMHRADRLIE